MIAEFTDSFMKRNAMPPLNESNANEDKTTNSDNFDGNLGSSTLLKEKQHQINRSLKSRNIGASDGGVVGNSTPRLDNGVTSVVYLNGQTTAATKPPLTTDTPKLHNNCLEKVLPITEPTLDYQLSRVWGARIWIPWDKFIFLAAVAAWFLVGVIAIVTTKILATTWKVPPLLLTTQQMILGSTLLRWILEMTQAIQPWPQTTRIIADTEQDKDTDGVIMDVANTTSPLIDKSDGGSNVAFTRAFTNDHPSYDRDFILVGLFNALDFLASNSAFHCSDASFVETIKASEPITTTMVALIWRIDQLQLKEGMALLVLISGVLLATFDNAETHEKYSHKNASMHTLKAYNDQPEKALAYLAFRTALTVMIANICFAFRALSQKKYRANKMLRQLNDVNLLYRMQQMGAVALVVPSLVAHWSIVFDSVLLESTSRQLHYLMLAAINSSAFACYNAASCYVLSNVSVLHHSGLNCLRRMFVTIVTCIIFGISMSGLGITGILLCFTGFISFTHIRAMRKFQPQSLPTVASLGISDGSPGSSTSHVKPQYSKV